MAIGAKYYKCDFQVHTPRDINFSGADCVTDGERDEYSKKFIAACREKGIDAVAITDHHDLAFYPYIKRAAEFEGRDSEKDPMLPIEERILVFPGLELTLDVPCQAIVLFDAFMEIDEILAARIYTVLGINNFHQASVSKTALTLPININHINELFEKLDSIHELRNKYFVLPNVKDSGEFTILRAKAHNQYATGKFIAGYLDGNIYDKCSAKKGWDNIINGKTEAYGNRSIAIFQTSDNRHESFELLGTAHTWVKFYEPSAEGLRQACLARQSRISQVSPKLPNAFISKIEVVSSTFFHSIELFFNSQLNVLIGGRGTGKSSVLQYIMFALGIKKNATNDFISETLNGGYVQITIIKNGVNYTIKRSLSEHLLKMGENDWEQTSEKVISNVIQVDAYVQKELSEHKNNRIELVNHLVSFPIKDLLNDIEKKLEDNASAIRKCFTDYQRLIQLLNRKNEINSQKKSLSLQIEELSKALNSQPNEQSILDRQNLIEKEQQFVEKLHNEYNSFIADLQDTIKSKNVNTSIPEADVVNKKEVKEYVGLIEQSVNEIITVFQNTLTKNANSTRISALREVIIERQKEQTTEYESAKNKLSESKDALLSIEKNRTDLTVCEIELNNIEKEIENLTGTKIKILKLFLERHSLSNNEFQLKKSEATRLSTPSEGCMKITLNYRNDFSEIIGQFENKIQKVRGTSENIDNYFKETLLTEPNKCDKNVLAFWCSIFARKNNLVEDFNALLVKFKIRNNGGINESNVSRILNIDENDLLEVALVLPKYHPIMEYNVNKTNKIPFHSASYGQQAGAILSILLNQAHGPLIIDQPEDDLDNRVIHQITERICATKENRQLIFSSHNANIAVNGDAELIIHFDHNQQSKGEIKERGAIDAENIKASILDIMEGGEKAFELRKKKYNLDI